MVRSTSLEKIFEEHKERLAQYEKELAETQQEITRTVFESGDSEYIKVYEKLVDKLHSAAEDRTLAEKITGLMELLSPQEKEKAAESSFISYNEAIELLKRYDGDRGHPLISSSGYRQRIRKGIKEGGVKTKEEDGRVYIDTESLEKYAK